mgnify:CR=1 FL=1
MTDHDGHEIDHDVDASPHQEGGPVCAAGDNLLVRLEARPRLAPAQIRALATDTRSAVAREQACRSEPHTLDIERHALHLAKWRAIHNFMHKTPYRDKPGIKRSQQWSAVIDRVRDVGERELLDWVLLQVDVARNLEKGVQDMRPRKNGPTFLVMLEYVANRKRKALAILKWVKAAERDGYYCVDGEFHAETRRILIEYGLCERDPNGAIIPSDDPLVRI